MTHDSRRCWPNVACATRAWPRRQRCSLARLWVVLLLMLSVGASRLGISGASATTTATPSPPSGRRGAAAATTLMDGQATTPAGPAMDEPDWLPPGDDGSEPPQSVVISETLQTLNDLVNKSRFDLNFQFTDIIFNETIELIDYLLDAIDVTYATDHPETTNRVITTISDVLSIGYVANRVFVHADVDFAAAVEGADLTETFPGATFIVYGNRSGRAGDIRSAELLREPLDKTNVSGRNPLAVVVLPRDVTRNIRESRSSSSSARSGISIQFNVFSHSPLFNADLLDNRSANFSIASAVVSSQLGAESTYNLTDPVTLFFKPLLRIPGGEVVCAFWDLDVNGNNGGWSTHGCRLAESSNPDLYACECSHLTTFSLLMVLRGDNLGGSSYHSSVVVRVSVYGLSASTFFLALTLIVSLCFRDLRHDCARKMFIQFTAVLLTVQVLSIVDFLLKASRERCIVLGVLLHFFLLVLFAWSSAQALHIYRLIVAVFSAEISRFFAKAVCVCYGVPAIIVFVTMAAGSFRFSSYAPPNVDSLNICYIPRTYSSIFGLYLPIGLVIVGNCVVFVVVMVTAVRKAPSVNKNDSSFADKLQFCRVTVATFILLGLSWVVGLLALAVDNRAVDLVFTALLSLTGLFVFVTKILLVQKARALVRERLASLHGMTTGLMTTSSGRHSAPPPLSANALEAPTNPLDVHSASCTTAMSDAGSNCDEGDIASTDS